MSHLTLWLIGTALGGLLLALLARQLLLRDEVHPLRGEAGSTPTAQEYITDWSDSELYAVWCATATELLEALHAEHTVTAAEGRQSLLAEIERRYPAETAAWLESEAILAGEPPHFLHPRGTR